MGTLQLMAEITHPLRGPGRRPGADVPPQADDQGGAFTHDQARAAGLTGRQVERRVDSGAWRRVAGRALTAEPAPDHHYRRAWAGVLTWSDAVVGLETAGAVHGLPPPRSANRGQRAARRPPPIDMFVRVSRRSASGLVAVRRPLRTDEVDRVGGLAVTSRRRTAVDLLATRSWPEALDLYAWLTSRQLLDHDWLAAQVMQRHHRRGAPQLRRLLAFTVDGAVSVPERRAHTLLREAGISGWQAGARITGPDGFVAVVDILFPRSRLVVEIDGWRTHGTRRAFEEDRRRQNRLMALGFRVLRFTWSDLMERPEVVVRTILELL